MSPKDPFESIRQTYGSLRKEYESVIVPSFEMRGFRRYNEVLFSAHTILTKNTFKMTIPRMPSLPSS
jgi:hypothetical protein